LATEGKERRNYQARDRVKLQRGDEMVVLYRGQHRVYVEKVSNLPSHPNSASLTLDRCAAGAIKLTGIHSRAGCLGYSKTATIELDRGGSVFGNESEAARILCRPTRSGMDVQTKMVQGLACQSKRPYETRGLQGGPRGSLPSSQVTAG
jgi:hypothetical protein